MFPYVEAASEKILMYHLKGLINTVADPDPYVFGPPGSGCILVRGSDPAPDLLSSSKNNKKNQREGEPERRLEGQ
jgi:hypothetical protein